LVHKTEGHAVRLRLVGVVHDPSFGPVIACGAGGTTAELLEDVAVRITPRPTWTPAEMVRSLATFPLLDGYRGARKADVAALEDLLLRVDAMVEAYPEIAQLDCNPVKVLPEGAVVVDARVRVDAVSPPRHWPPPAVTGRSNGERDAHTRCARG
jgi:acyl-CoA synthetase (NDP forming)